MFKASLKLPLAGGAVVFEKLVKQFHNNNFHLSATNEIELLHVNYATFIFIVSVDSCNGIF